MSAELRTPDTYIIDPDDPRAPPLDVWERMSPEERARVVEMLPAEIPLERRAQAEAERAQAEARRAQVEAERVARLERELAEAKEEIERLRQSKKAGE